MATLLAGHGRASITPPVGTRMMGYSSRTEGARGVHDDLFVNAVAVQAGGETVALVAYDLCFFDLPLVARIKSAVRRATGLDSAHVLLNTSHTHAGPAVGAWCGQTGDTGYEQTIIVKTVETVLAALKDATKCTFAAGSAPLDIGCNRREKKPDGMVVVGVNPQGRRLPVMTVWRFKRSRKGGDIVLFSTPMHGTTLGGENLVISAEWMGAAARHVETQIPSTRAVFLQGCGADQNPYRERADFQLVEQHGGSAAKAVMTARNHMRPLRPVPQRCAARQVPLPLLGVESKTCPLPLHLVRLGDAILVGLGCEPFVEYALFARSVSAAAEILVIGYTDGSVGYLPTAKAYEEGGYETEANRYFPVGKPFAPCSEQIVKDAMRAALEEVTG